MSAILDEIKSSASNEFVAIAKQLAAGADPAPSKDQITNMLLASGRTMAQLEEETAFWKTAADLRAASNEIGPLQEKARDAEAKFWQATEKLKSIVEYADALIKAGEAQRDLAQGQFGLAQGSLLSTQELIRGLQRDLDDARRRRAPQTINREEVMGQHHGQFQGYAS